jgi:hypothetical protein
VYAALVDLAVQQEDEDWRIPRCDFDISPLPVCPLCWLLFPRRARRVQRWWTGKWEKGERRSPPPLLSLASSSHPRSVPAH